MPTRTITMTVCTTCGKQTCDGALWDWVLLTRLKDGANVPLSTIPAENRINTCSLSYGRSNLKALTGKAVGDEVELTFPRWVEASKIRIRKVAA